mgnify:CR=1 FL=1
MFYYIPTLLIFSFSCPLANFPNFIGQKDTSHNKNSALTGYQAVRKNALEIFEVLEITPVEFFSDDPTSYLKDKKLLDYFSKLTDKQKDAILNLYN